MKINMLFLFCEKSGGYNKRKQEKKPKKKPKKNREF